MVCADCTLLPRVLLPSEVGHPQNIPPGLRSLCTAWQHSYRRLSSSAYVRSWTAFSWKTNQFLMKRKPIILIQSSPFLCLCWQSQAMGSGLPSVWIGSYVMYRIFYIKSKAQVGSRRKINIPMNGWVLPKCLLHLTAAFTLNFLLFWFLFPSPHPEKNRLKGCCHLNALFYSQWLFYAEMSREWHFKQTEGRQTSPIRRANCCFLNTQGWQLFSIPTVPRKMRADDSSSSDCNFCWCANL